MRRRAVSRPGCIEHKSPTFARIDCAVAVHTILGVACRMYCASKLSLLLTNSATARERLRARIASLGEIFANHRSTWLIHDAYVGV